MAGWIVVEEKFMTDKQVADLLVERGGKLTKKTRGIITEVYGETGAHIATMEHDRRNGKFTVRMER